MRREDLKKYNLPDAPGVYIFKNAKGRVQNAKLNDGVVYVGKATSLRDRVKSYFSKDLLQTRGGKVAAMVLEATKLEWIETDSVLEALILEANLIKKYTPVGNTRDKDNKSFNYVVITEEEFPRVVMVRGRELFAEKSVVGAMSNARHIFGPYPDGGALKEALRMVRKIFPFRDTCTPMGSNPIGAEQGRTLLKKYRVCFNKQIGLCPGVCDGTCTKKEYAMLVRNITLFFSGKKKELLKALEKDMKLCARSEDFESAARIRKQLYSLTHIRDVALIKKDAFGDGTHADVGVSDGGEINLYRIEAYDVAHISGTNTVGVMVVMEGGEIQKAEIRKFIIRTSKNDDLASLTELLTRRFRHSEWRAPHLVVIDGGETHIVHARGVLARLGVTAALVSVVKDDTHKARGLLGDQDALARYRDNILHLNAEAHAQAVKFHRTRRSRGLRVRRAR